MQVGIPKATPLIEVARLAQQLGCTLNSSKPHHFELRNGGDTERLSRALQRVEQRSGRA